MTAIDELIDNYRARGVDADVWELLHPLVSALVRRAQPDTVSMCTRFLTLVSQYVVWAATEQIPLDVETLSSNAAIESFLPNTTWSDAGSVSTIMGRVARGGKAPTHGRNEYRGIRPPYAPAEEQAFFSFVRQVPNPETANELLAYLCLGFGAGLKSREIVHATPEWLVVRDGIRCVHVADGPNQRIVPLDDPYGDLLSEAVARCRTERLVTGDRRLPTKNPFGHVSALVDRAGLGRLTAGRCRTTWLVRLASNPAPLWVWRDIAAAGSRTFRGLFEYIDSPAQQPSGEASPVSSVDATLAWFETVSA